MLSVDMADARIRREPFVGRHHARAPSFVLRQGEKQQFRIWGRSSLDASFGRPLSFFSCLPSLSQVSLFLLHLIVLLRLLRSPGPRHQLSSGARPCSGYSAGCRACHAHRGASIVQVCWIRDAHARFVMQMPIFDPPLRVCF
jgi:hypothetical protein